MPHDAGWTPRATQDGSWTLEHAGLGEACHSLSGAWTEALERYARPTRLAERACAGARTLRLLDVGTGLGWNLAAACAVLAGTDCALECVTLERDASVFAAASGLPQSGPGAVWQARVLAALTRGAQAPDEFTSIAETPHRVRVIVGDARASICDLPSAGFDAVFLDGFSPTRAPQLWSTVFLAQVARCMAPASLLSSYSASFWVRLDLLRAGLRVGCGARVGTKSEGTLASPDLELEPLRPKVQRRLDRLLAADVPGPAVQRP